MGFEMQDVERKVFYILKTTQVNDIHKDFFVTSFFVHPLPGFHTTNWISNKHNDPRTSFRKLL